jgi:hypothetical protein
MKKKTIKQILFLYCILLEVTSLILLLDVIKGMVTNQALSFAAGLPCNYIVLSLLSILSVVTLIPTYILLKDESFE